MKLNVVRQTISKWEQGLSVPDSDLLIALSEALETPVSTLLGETVANTSHTRWSASSTSCPSSLRMIIGSSSFFYRISACV